ncbi:MAG: TetR/AcrR family transcriptional regulator [Candidatus Limnocylindrales bacterium]
MAPRRIAKVRPQMSRERVLRAAMDLADRDGLESLTMRRLASALGVEVMTLYYYVAKKDDILDAIVDLVASEIEVPSGGAAGWRAAARQRAISAHDVLVRHPWASLLWVSREALGPGRLRYMDAGLRGFREAGFSPELTEHAFHAVENHIVGYTLQEMSFAIDPEAVVEEGARFLAQLPVDEYPDLATHVAQHLEGAGHLDAGDFEFALDLILDGIERIKERG